MILADENIDGKIIHTLREKGFSVFSIAEEHSGIKDREVISISRNPKRIILTEDKDFGEWVFAHKEAGLSVVFLRYHFQETDRIIEILTHLFSTLEDKLWHHFTTVTTDKIRSRKI